MTYHKPEVVESGTAMNVIKGDLGKPFCLFLDFRSMHPPTMTPGAYEADE